VENKLKHSKWFIEMSEIMVKGGNKNKFKF